MEGPSHRYLLVQELFNNIQLILQSYHQITIYIQHSFSLGNNNAVRILINDIYCFHYFFIMRQALLNLPISTRQHRYTRISNNYIIQFNKDYLHA